MRWLVLCLPLLGCGPSCEEQGGKSRPDNAPIAAVAVYLGEDVAEEVGDRKEQDAGEKSHRTDSGKGDRRGFRRPYEVRA